MIADTAKIAAVPRAKFRPIVGTREFGWFVVRGIAVSEAVGHDQVNDVTLGKTVKAGRRWQARRYRKFEFGFARGSENAADERAAAGIRSEFEPNEEIVPLM